MKGLTGKVAVITGGASGIGLATAAAFAERGVSVAIADIDEEAGRKAESLLGERALFVRADVSDEQQIIGLMRAAAARFGRLDILVNSAVALVAKGVEATPEEWGRAFATNVFGYALCAKHALPYMRERGGGAIVNISSISALIAQPDRITYSAGKGALQSLTRGLALDLAADGIRVNAVCPGTIWTPPNEAYLGATMGLDRAGADAHPAVGGEAMLRRVGGPEEVAEAVVFLASDSAGYITAASLVVDGGQTAR
ncbi:short-chain dehydrogenase [Spongiactinospora gelatinilytica]|uniref:Short-chain dehydrogenase n=1 Tax=Spongiactinospora gelatinilytica TaxID=2666298 RepID=A0A2W2GYX7_9ACTN|nr:SDR family oxidoreductase [Spongiactinospora gelatinilytica]PZG32104.1 short-chain dehydrogenase [Spongiactinospora gelatinilytica]